MRPLLLGIGLFFRVLVGTTKTTRAWEPTLLCDQLHQLGIVGLKFAIFLVNKD